MRYADVSPTMRMFMGTWEGFRKLGYSAADLFCEVHPSVKLGGALGCFCVLRTQGKEFSVECGPVMTSKDFFIAEYQRVAEAVSSGQFVEADLDRIWVECEIYHRKVDFLLALEAKGFTSPKAMPN